MATMKFDFLLTRLKEEEKWPDEKIRAFIAWCRMPPSVLEEDKFINTDWALSARKAFEGPDFKLKRKSKPNSK